MLAADTIVVIGNEILGKPADEADARWMLEVTGARALRGAARRAVGDLAEAVEAKFHGRSL